MLLMASLVLTGCQSPRVPTRVSAEAAARDVLDEHRFASPTVLPGADGVTYVVAARSDPQLFLEMVVVCIGADRKVRVQIHAYQYFSSDWAVLGPMITKDLSDKEALVIEQSIKARMEKRRQASNEVGRADVRQPFSPVPIRRSVAAASRRSPLRWVLCETP
jgi:hypothetical protein